MNETHLAFEECSWRTRNAPKADVVAAVRGTDVVRSSTLPFGEAVVETAPGQHLSTWLHATPAAMDESDSCQNQPVEMGSITGQRVWRISG